jgi:hypothetical protein
VPVGFAILSSHAGPDAASEVRLWRVVWDAAEAAEIVQRLNARGGDGVRRYSWQEIWVPAHDGGVRLTPEDRELLSLAALHGVKDTERPLAVFFSFIFNRTAAKAAVEELRALGWPEPDMDEELTDDDFWHVYAHGRRGLLSEAGITELRREMEGVAERHGGTFDSWEVGRGGELRRGKPGEISE